MKETLLNILLEIGKRRGMVREDNYCIVCNSPIDIEIRNDRVFLICQFKEHCLLSLPIKEKENLENIEVRSETPSEFKDIEGHRISEWEYNRAKRYLEKGLSLRATKKALEVDNIFLSLGTLSKIKKSLENNFNQ